MSLTTEAEVRALVETALDDVSLQAVIDREEAWLARRIGPLSGPRTVTYRYPDVRGVIQLDRPTDAVTVTDNAVATPIYLDGYAIERQSGYWTGPVSITSTPNDLDEVKRAVIQLVSLTLRGPNDLASEQIGSYSYQRFGAQGQSGAVNNRGAIVRSLQPPRHPTSVALSR